MELKKNGRMCFGVVGENSLREIPFMRYVVLKERLEKEIEEVLEHVVACEKPLDVCVNLE
jgi:hypothetical protein